MKLTKNQLYSLSNIFSPIIIGELLKFGYSNKLYRILKDSNMIDLVKNQELHKLYDITYKILSKQYPNEYIYKNVIANTVLLGIHSLNTSFMLTEFRANNSKVDCVIINGTLTVYEIKTRYDNFQRLSKQIEDYKKVFEKIYVITDELHLAKLDYLESEGIGIKKLNSNGKISTLYKAKSQFEHIDLSIVFDSLRQNEYLHIINKLCGNVPDVPNTKIYIVCKEIFCNLEKKMVYKEVVSILKQRGKSQKLKDFINEVPKSLKIRAIESSLTVKEKIRFVEILKTKTINLLSKGQQCTIHI